MSDAYCTPGREPRSVAASSAFFGGIYFKVLFQAVIAYIISKKNVHMRYDAWQLRGYKSFYFLGYASAWVHLGKTLKKLQIKKN